MLFAIMITINLNEYMMLVITTTSYHGS